MRSLRDKNCLVNLYRMHGARKEIAFISPERNRSRRTGVCCNSPSLSLVLSLGITLKFVCQLRDLNEGGRRDVGKEGVQAAPGKRVWR